MNNNKGSMIILTVIGIATLLIAVIGATFAFFTVTVKYNTDPSEVVVESNTMVIEFETLNNIEYKGAIPGRPADDLKDNKLRFKVSSKNDMMTTTPYDVYLKIEKNEFANEKNMENLVFYLYQTKVGTSLGTTNAVNSVKGNMFANKMEDYLLNTTIADIGGSDTVPVKIGVIPNNTDPTTCAEESLSEDKTACMLKISENAVLGNQGAIDEWYFEVWVKETGVNQNYDQGKTLKASIEIVPHDLSAVTNEPDKINP